MLDYLIAFTNSTLPMRDVFGDSLQLQVNHIRSTLAEGFSLVDLG